MESIKRGRVLLATIFLPCFALLLLGAFATAWAQASSDNATVKVGENSSFGAHITDMDGRTLYFFSEDSRRASKCYGYCANAYPAYTIKGRPIAGDGALSALLGTIKRKNGKLQVTYAGHPLYYFGGDIQPGGAAGASKRYGAEWFAVTPGGKVAKAPSKNKVAKTDTDKEQTAETGQKDSKNPFEGDSEAIAEGKKLYMKVGCYGCHGRSGGGGMGPSLVDSQWRYGNSDADLFKTIVQGRPKGMPAWGSHFTDDQVWEIIAYIRSLSD